jgi:hypothetical protein
MKKLYVDMDGVLCDFDGQCRKYFPDMSENETPREYSHKIGTNKFWKTIRETKGEFWSTMEPLDENIVEIWSRLNKLCPHIAILSSPDNPDPYCIEGKNIWLDKYFGPRQMRLFTKEKHKYACSNSLLIDDFDKNTEPWKENKGHAILFKGSFDSSFWSMIASFFNVPENEKA